MDTVLEKFNGVNLPLRCAGMNKEGDRCNKTAAWLGTYQGEGYTSAIKFVKTLKSEINKMGGHDE